MERLKNLANHRHFTQKSFQLLLRPTVNISSFSNVLLTVMDDLLFQVAFPIACIEFCRQTVATGFVALDGKLGIATFPIIEPNDQSRLTEKEEEEEKTGNDQKKTTYES